MAQSRTPSYISVIALGIQLNAAYVNATEQSMQTGYNNSRTISVIGTGVEHGTPGFATTTIGVATIANAPEEALRTNNERAERLIAALKQAGSDEADIQTASVNIYSEPEVHPNSGQMSPLLLP